MSPAHIARRVEYARAVSRNLREVARENGNAPALAGRLIQAAQAIDEMANLAEQSTFVAKLNHETIVAGAGK